MDLGRQANQLCKLETFLEGSGQGCFTHGIFEDAQQYYSRPSIENNLDYVSCQLVREVEFACFVVGVEKTDILRNGLSTLNDGFEGVLGKGIYAVPRKDWFAYCSLKELLETIEDDILVVEGAFSGAYQVCLEGPNLQGVIVFKEDIKPSSISSVNLLVR